MRITADTNVLVRAAVADDPDQAKLAAEALRDAEIVAVTLPALCEFVWVLARGYRREVGEIIGAIRHLVDSATVSTDRPAVDVGLAVMAAGGTLPMASSHLKADGSAAPSSPASIARR
jgi:predicted nucleic-acid-binding protein